MRSLQSRLERLEDAHIADEVTVYISHHLDSTIPDGLYGRVTNGQALTILSSDEYIEEISTCKNLITIGEAYHD